MIRILGTSLAGLAGMALWTAGPLVDVSLYRDSIPDLSTEAQDTRELTTLAFRVRVTDDLLHRVAQAANMLPECVRSIESEPGACISIVGERTDVVVMRRQEDRGDGASAWVGVNLVVSSSPPPYPMVGMRFHGQPSFTSLNTRAPLYLMGVPPEAFLDRYRQRHPAG